MKHDDKVAFETAIHMVKCNITVIRYGIVTNKMDMIGESLNELERTVLALERRLSSIKDSN